MKGIMMEKLFLYRPRREELDFRQALLADPKTMAYNHAYGGAIDFPRERWADWYARWLEDRVGERFYRYLRREGDGKLVGEAAYYRDEAFGEYVCDVLVAAQYRGRGYGRQGLELLCAAAKENGVGRLVDNIAVDNPSVGLFLGAGFRERLRNEEYILVEKTL